MNNEKIAKRIVLIACTILTFLICLCFFCDEKITYAKGYKAGFNSIYTTSINVTDNKYETKDGTDVKEINLIKNGNDTLHYFIINKHK